MRESSRQKAERARRLAASVETLSTLDEKISVLSDAVRAGQSTDDLGSPEENDVFWNELQGWEVRLRALREEKDSVEPKPSVAE